jgi:hypothetical protein
MNSHALASTSRRLLLLALIAAGCMLLAAPRAIAAPCEDKFTETVGSGWSATANWSTGQVPTSLQTVCLAAGFQVEIGPGVSAEASTITGPVPLRVDAGGTLHVADSADLQGAAVVDGEIAGAGATVTLKSGSLVGTGTIQPRFINEAGVVEPGGDGAVGTLSFGNEYAQGEAGQLDLDLASDSSFDRLQPLPTSNALIGGRIDVRVLGSYAPSVGMTWDFISGSAGAGFSGTMAPSQFSVHSFPGGADLRLDSALPSGPSGGEGEAPSGGGSPEPNGPGQAGAGSSTAPTDPVGPPASSQPTTAGDRGGSPGGAPVSACGASPLTISSASVKAGRLIVTGSAPRSLAGKRVRVLRGAKAVAKTEVRADGTFRASAPAPKVRQRASAVYVAAVGALRSCGVRLEPKRAGGA